MRGLSPKHERDGDMGPLIKGGIGTDFTQPQGPVRGNDNSNSGLHGTPRYITYD